MMTDITYSEAVELVARAICKAELFDPDAVMDAGQEQLNWCLFADDARAAIAAVADVLKEPTEAMNAAGASARHSKACDGEYEVVGRLNAETAYRAMLAASPLHYEVGR